MKCPKCGSTTIDYVACGCYCIICDYNTGKQPEEKDCYTCINFNKCAPDPKLQLRIECCGNDSYCNYITKNGES